MDEFDTSKMIYNSQFQTSNLAPIKILATQAYRPSVDNYALQGEALHVWSENMEAMNRFLCKGKVEIREIQLSKIKNLVDDAFQHVPFYREFYGNSGYEVGAIRNFSDFEKLPIVSKAMLNNFDPTIRVNDPRVIESANASTTSGSSGKPFTVYTDDSDIVLDHLQVMRFYNSCLQHPLQESDWIYVIHHSGLAFSSLHGKYRTFHLPDLLSDTPLGKHLRFLRPRLLITLPSYLPLILKHKAELKMCGVEAILTNSESSTQLERTYYSTALGIPIFDEYSSEEIGLIATQCAYGQYHVIEDGAYVEVINMDDSGFGSIICTDLDNRIMPLIRFDHGDVARKRPDGGCCECGSHCTSLFEINGRKDDAFFNREKQVIPSASILAAIDTILVSPDKLMRAFRLIQKSATTLELLTQFGPEPHKPMSAILQELQKRISSLFGYSVDLLHREVDALPEQNSYKRRCIVREWCL